MKPLKALFLYLFFFNIVNSQSLPKWYSSGKISGYDSKQYLLGFGVGQDFNEASSKAQEQIAAQIKNQIKSEIKIVEKEVQNNNSSATSSSISQSIKTSVEGSIAGATILARETIKGKHYAAAGISKTIFISSLEFKSMELQQRLNILFEDAQKSISAGQLGYFYKNKSVFEESYLELASTKALLRSFGSPSMSTPNMDFENLINNIREIDLSITDGQKQAVVLGFPFKNQVIVKATMKYNDNTIPLVNFPIRTEGIDPKEIKTWTNSDGLANFRLPASFSENNARSIKFVLVKSQLPGNGKGLPQANSPTLRFTTVKTLPMVFDMEFLDESSVSKKVLSNVRKKVTKTITGMGHSISENDKLLIRNTISVENPKEVEGKDGTMYLVTGELFIELVSLKNNKVIATINSSSKGLDKKSQQKALEKSVKSMKLSKRDFGKLLDQAENEVKNILKESSEDFLQKGEANLKLRKYDEAMKNLINVNYGDKLIVKAKSMMNEIQNLIIKEEEERIFKEAQEKEKERQFALEKERIKAQAKIQSKKLEADKAWALMKKAEFEKQSAELKSLIINTIQNNKYPYINNLELEPPFNSLSPYEQILLFFNLFERSNVKQPMDSEISNEIIIGSWELITALKNDNTIFDTGKDSEFLVFSSSGEFKGFGLSSPYYLNPGEEKFFLGDKEIMYKIENNSLFLTFRILSEVYTLAYEKIVD